MSSLSAAERQRYSRHLSLPHIGVEGQIRLKKGAVLLIGIGGLGSPAALYLAAAGVGRIGLVDFDRVDLSNLQRQILFDVDDVGRSKVQVAGERLRKQNPHIQLDLHDVKISAENLLPLIQMYDVVLDGTDNLVAKYLINDACVLGKKPLVAGAISRFSGQISFFGGAGGPCYRCLHPEAPDLEDAPSCAGDGVMGVLPGVIGTLQATEVIKYLVGKGEALTGRLLRYDAWDMSFSELRLARDPNCPICSTAPVIDQLREESFGCRDQMREGKRLESNQVTVQELANRLNGEKMPVLLDVREEIEYEHCRLEGAVWIPLKEVAQRMTELSPKDEIVVYCHTGFRSQVAMQILMKGGFAKVRNLVGGIAAWSREIDPSVPQY